MPKGNIMRILFAPMEGLTGYTFRNVHHRLYDGVSEYFTPFLAIRQTMKWKTREIKDIDPINNQGITVVPQLLTNNADDFIWAARNLAAMGYAEVNLNLGCPSATVVTKHKGAGFLEDPDALDIFFEKIFEELSDEISISVKTRLGFSHASEMTGLLRIFNRYPIKRLIVHPRVREDYYTGPIDLDAFQMVLENSVNPVVYNGEINSVEDYQEIIRDFPHLNEIMIGRGLIRHPDLAERIFGINTDSEATQRFFTFHDSLLAEYLNDMQESDNCLQKMKDLWNFLTCDFPDRTRELKKIKKARSLDEYRLAVQFLQ